jgi:hypothetical protein
MSFNLAKPYQIVSSKTKRYGNHYNIPAEDAVVIPIKSVGDEVLCDIRWEDSNGELKLLEKVMFVTENLIPMNEMLKPKQFELWKHYQTKC